MMRLAVTGFFVAIPFLMAACRDSSDPAGDPVTLRLSGPVSVAGESAADCPEGSTDGPCLRCTTELTGTVAGPTGSRAVWDAATVTVTDLETGEVSRTQTLRPEELEEMWRTGTLEAGGDYAVTGHAPSHHGPFRVTMTFYYQTGPDAELRSARHSYECQS